METNGKEAEKSATSPELKPPRKDKEKANTERIQPANAPQPFRKMVAPSIKNRERKLRKEQGRHNPDEDSEQSEVYETPAQERKRLHIEELRILQALPRSQRQQALLERQPLADLGAEEEERQHKLKLFLRKINKDEDYPMEAIKNLLLMKMQEYEN